MSNAFEYVNSKDWRETNLFKRIKASKDKDARSVETLLNLWMPEIALILSSADTAPSDYTLHDQNHSLRVADRMWSIMTPATRSALSIFELALLLLSSHLHDIGMTPSQKKVTSHFDYLLLGSSPDLSDQEKIEFDTWRAENGKGLEGTRDSWTNEQLATARIVTSNYCRHRHNEWGADWTYAQSRRTGDLASMGSYKGWLEDLVLLCKSHHYDCQRLIENDFSPRLVGSAGKIVHLRYLAVVLRIADILDFDPERTPEVVFRHRDIASQSLIHWHKDHEFSVVLEGGNLIASARPSSAALYKAVEDVINDIDKELIACQWLDRQTKFDSCPALKKPIKYEWYIAGPVHRDIAPKNNAFVYIDSNFRPDTQRILELLSGKNLYGGSLASVREIIQNSFDAVKERMAYQRLESSDEDDQDGVWQSSHSVIIFGEKSNGRYYLCCKDSGVGMNKDIIEKSFLVAGHSRRQELIKLEKRCQKAGFELGRTGQFGIGVLSFFMIADQIELVTKRAGESLDADLDGWIFSIDGISSFGELRKHAHAAVGSAIKLRLKSEYSDDNFLNRVSEYIRSTVSFLPCRLIIKNFEGVKLATHEPGWLNDEQEIKSRLLPRGLSSGTLALPSDLLPQRIVEANNQRDDQEEALHKRINLTAQLAQEEECLPDGLGRYRINILYFILGNHISLLYADILECDSKIEISPYGKGLFIPAERAFKMSWKGMLVQNVPNLKIGNSAIGVSVETDFFKSDAGYISVDRDYVTLSEGAQSALRYVETRVSRKIEELCRMNSRLSAFNKRLINSGSQLPAQWLFDKDEKKSSEKYWDDVDYPAITTYSWGALNSPLGAIIHGKYHRLLKSVPVGINSNNSIPWYSSSQPPDQVYLINEPWSVNLCPVWTRAAVENMGSLLKISEFAPGLEFLACCQFSAKGDYPSILVWNKSNPIYHLLSETDFRWAKGLSGSEIVTAFMDLDSDVDLVKCVSLVAVIISSGEKGDIIWESLLERCPTKILSMLSKIGGEGFVLEKWIQNGYSSSLTVFEPDSLKFLKLDKDREQKDKILEKFAAVPSESMIDARRTRDGKGTRR